MKRILRIFACCTRDEELEKNEIKQCNNTLKDILNEYTIDIDIDENIKNKKLREINRCYFIRIECNGTKHPFLCT